MNACSLVSSATATHAGCLPTLNPTHPPGRCPCRLYTRASIASRIVTRKWPGPRADPEGLLHVALRRNVTRYSGLPCGAYVDDALMRVSHQSVVVTLAGRGSVVDVVATLLGLEPPGGIEPVSQRAWLSGHAVKPSSRDRESKRSHFVVSRRPARCRISLLPSVVNMDGPCRLGSGWTYTRGEFASLCKFYLTSGVTFFLTFPRCRSTYPGLRPMGATQVPTCQGRVPYSTIPYADSLFPLDLDTSLSPPLWSTALSPLHIDTHRHRSTSGAVLHRPGRCRLCTLTLLSDWKEGIYNGQTR